jgi:hypothetical protein
MLQIDRIKARRLCAQELNVGNCRNSNIIGAKFESKAVNANMLDKRKVRNLTPTLQNSAPGNGLMA